MRKFVGFAVVACLALTLTGCLGTEAGMTAWQGVETARANAYATAAKARAENPNEVILTIKPPAGEKVATISGELNLHVKLAQGSDGGRVPTASPRPKTGAEVVGDVIKDVPGYAMGMVGYWALYKVSKTALQQPKVQAGRDVVQGQSASGSPTTTTTTKTKTISGQGSTEVAEE